MSKLSIDLSFVVPGTRGLKDVSVARALEYMARNGHGGTADPEEGDEVSQAERAALAIVYAARRMMALNKDADRVEHGKLATRFYAPRVEQTKNAPKRLLALVTSVHGLSPSAVKPAKVAKPVKAPTAKPVKVAPAKVAPVKVAPVRLAR